MQASVRIDPDLRRRSQLLWDDRSQPTRGPKPGVTPDDVVQAAMQIADEDGLAAVTMNAVATRLGFTTMAIYRYFPNKETLFDAIVDAGMGLPPRPTEPRGDWRARSRSGRARSGRCCVRVRGWRSCRSSPRRTGRTGSVGSRRSPSRSPATGLSSPDMGEMISVIDGYTRGASDTAISLARARARGTSELEWAAAVGADLGRAIGDPRFPKFAAMLTTPSDGRPRTMEESFEFGLQRVLDGIELYVKSAKAKSMGRGRAAT